MPPRKSMGKGLNVLGKLEKCVGLHKKRFETNKWESSITLLPADVTGAFPKPSCACRDPLRGAKLRLVKYYNKNLKDVLSCHSDEDVSLSEKGMKTTFKTRLRFKTTLRRAKLPYTRGSD